MNEREERDFQAGLAAEDIDGDAGGAGEGKADEAHPLGQAGEVTQSSNERRHQVSPELPLGAARIIAHGAARVPADAGAGGLPTN